MRSTGSAKHLWNDARRSGTDKTAKRMRDVKYSALRNLGDPIGKQNEAFGTLKRTDLKGQSYRIWRFKELLHTLLKHTISQACGGTQLLGVPGVPRPHPRDRQTHREDPAMPARHPQDHPARLFKR